ncbi:glycosyltransferase [Frigoribacterium endophyticum]|uniref:glycosyltransferase n=1 Tax=Frigoribacterium endophyticum TaxID=1522176 RepID=UPI001423E35F|nr:N-acetylglucosaminyl-diphospho-decaprenol L-rhamnosyltransferase [Frigoribacterium endophyticum]
MTDVLCITVTYSPGPTLESFVDSLVPNGFPPARVVVVDNGSTDGAPEAVAESRRSVTLVRSPGNVGYGRAVNLGAQQAGPDEQWLLVCNPDTLATPDTLTRLLEAAHRAPRAGALGPRVLDPDGSVYPSARALPSIRTGIGHALLSGVWPSNPWTRRYQQRDVSASETAAEVGWLSGAFLLLRREAFEEIGGFDDDFFMYFEDVDLGRRLAEAGWSNLFVPDAVVTHVGGESTARSADAMVTAHHRSAHLYIAKTHPGALWRPVVWALGVGLRLRSRATVALARRRG